MPTARLALGGIQSGSSALVIDASNAIDPSSAAVRMAERASQEGAPQVSVTCSVVRQIRLSAMPNIWHHTTPPAMLAAARESGRGVRE